DDGNFKFPVSCEDEDDVPLFPKFSGISSLGACSSKHDASGKKNTTVPAKRVLDNNNYLHSCVKKSKVSPYDDHKKNEDDIPLSDLIKRPGKSTDDCFSLLMKDLELVENSYEECKMMTEGEEKRLQSIKRDIEECCKELENKKKKVCSVTRIIEAYDKMQRKIEECMKDFVVKEGQLYLMKELIEERKHEFKTKEIELIQVKVNISKEIELRQVIDKDRGRKEEELKALSQKIAEFTLELKAKEKYLDAMNKLIGEQAEKLDSERKNVGAQKKEFESVKKQFEGRIKELKQKQCERRVAELVSKE
ncbi:frigida-like protein, partial [Trifolium medium]|nr:frigida-like protein [Trifolium medium]